MAIGTYYDLLGVAPDAPTATIRDAYRRAARAHHPDRVGDTSAARMAEINQAWNTLSDPVRRRRYDRSLGEPETAPEPTRTTTTVLEPLPPARVPWRMLGVMFVLGVVFVVISVVTASEPPPPTVDHLLEPGSCVAIRPNGDAGEVLCTEPHQAVVEVLVPTGELCPAGTEPHRDEQGLGTACVRPI